MSKSNKSSGGGVGFCGLLQVAFIVLKLTSVIKWSWWWVLAPTWASLLLAVVLIIVAVIIDVITD